MRAVHGSGYLPFRVHDRSAVLARERTDNQLGLRSIDHLETVDEPRAIEQLEQHAVERQRRQPHARQLLATDLAAEPGGRIGLRIARMNRGDGSVFGWVVYTPATSLTSASDLPPNVSASRSNGRRCDAAGSGRPPVGAPTTNTAARR